MLSNLLTTIGILGVLVLAAWWLRQGSQRPSKVRGISGRLGLLNVLGHRPTSQTGRLGPVRSVTAVGYGARIISVLVEEEILVIAVTARGDVSLLRHHKQEATL